VLRVGDTNRIFHDADTNKAKVGEKLLGPWGKASLVLRGCGRERVIISLCLDDYGAGGASG